MPSYQISPFGKQAQIDTDEQTFLALATQHAPPEVREHGLQEIHSFPLVSRGKGCPVSRKPARLAWLWPEIELRTPNSIPALILDVDTSPMDYLNVALGPSVQLPNWIVSNPDTGNAHIVYCLARPVLYGDDMRLAPLSYHARICEFYRGAYDADASYTGVLTHNPVHGKWETSYLREAPYTLPELAEPMPKGWRMPPKPTTPEGRNVTLFKAAMRWFGRPSNWKASTDLDDVLAWIEQARDEWFGDNLHGWHRNECSWIAKSVCKISRKNLASGQTQRQLSLIQATKGKRGGKVSGVSRRARKADRDATIVERVRAGEKQEAVAAAYGITQGRVSQIISEAKAG